MQLIVICAGTFGSTMPDASAEAEIAGAPGPML
jgi:hypothetical protein